MKSVTLEILDKACRSLEAAQRDLAAADADNAISRAYYAAFHAATAALNERNLTARSHRGTHQLFHQHLVEPGHLDIAHSRALSHLFQSRLDADYTSGITFSEEAAADAVRQAEAFVDAVEGLFRS